VSNVPGLISRDVSFEELAYIITVHERNRQTVRQDYYGNTAICTIVHRLGLKTVATLLVDSLCM